MVAATHVSPSSFKSQETFSGRLGGDLPVGGPVHDVPAGDQGRKKVENLGAEAAPGVEDGVVGGTGEGVLAVRGDAVGDDTSLLLATCTSVSPDLQSHRP